MTVDIPRSVFFAYGSSDSLVRDSINHAARILRDNGVTAATWEDLSVGGTQILSEICRAIDDVECVVAEVGSMNSNVLFEAGYALGKSKLVVPALDETDESSERNWKSLKVLRTVGRLNYGGNAERLATQYLGELPTAGHSALLDQFLSGASPKELNSVFAPSSPVPTTQFDGLRKTLERSTKWRTHSSSDDLVLAPLDFYIKDIYRSTAAIVSLLGPNRSRAAEHNGRASFLAGVAYGMDLPVLMVAEPGFDPPFDYQDLLYKFSSSLDLQKYVNEWLDQHFADRDTNGRRQGRLALHVELPLQSFGQYVAELEREDLADYFVPTTEFSKMIRGESKIFVGRKGTGKTATMQRIVDELRGDTKNLVIAVKPASYELNGLVEALAKLGAASSSEYMLLSLWSYLIYTEIACQVVRYHDARPTGWPGEPECEAVSEELARLGVRVEDDLSIRLEHSLESLLAQQRHPREGEKEGIARAFRLEQVNRLQAKLAPALAKFSRVAVLFDNLDKAWQRGADYEAMSRFILSLLVASGKVERELRRGIHSTNGPEFTLSVFLRSDIYDALSRFAREPDKIETLEVRWSDEDLLLRVLEERFEALKHPDKSGVTPNLWAEIFTPEVRGLTTRDYIAWRALPRPRDVVYFANSALSTAVNNKHSIVQEPDFISAEVDYSEFAVEALLVEAQAESWNLEAALYEFAGADCTLTETETNAALNPHGNSTSILNWLVQSSFFGVEVAQDHFEHLEGATRAAMRLKVARQNALRDGRELRFRIHPAFRPFLEVKDSDIHNATVVDVTLAGGGE